MERERQNSAGFAAYTCLVFVVIVLVFQVAKTNERVEQLEKAVQEREALRMVDTILVSKNFVDIWGDADRPE